MNNDDILRLQITMGKQAEKFRDNFWGEIARQKMEGLFAEFLRARSDRDLQTMKLKADLLQELTAEINLLIDDGRVANFHLTKQNEVQ